MMHSEGRSIIDAVETFWYGSAQHIFVSHYCQAYFSACCYKESTVDVNLILMTIFLFVLNLQIYKKNPVTVPSSTVLSLFYCTKAMEFEDVLFCCTVSVI